MYTVVVAAMNRGVVAVDADLENLAYVRRSLDMQNTTSYVRLIHNAVSNTYTTLYPVKVDLKNAGGQATREKTQLNDNNIKKIGSPVSSVKLQDILGSIEGE